MAEPDHREMAEQDKMAEAERTTDQKENVAIPDEMADHDGNVRQENATDQRESVDQGQITDQQETRDLDLDKDSGQDSSSDVESEKHYTGPGRHLHNEVLLLKEMAEDLYSAQTVAGLAIRLLEKLGGGHDFMERHIRFRRRKRRMNIAMAKRILLEWIEELPDEAYGAELLKVLRELEEDSIAKKWEQVLMDSTSPVYFNPDYEEPDDDLPPSDAEEQKKYPHPTGKLIRRDDPVLMEIAKDGYFKGDKAVYRLTFALFKWTPPGGPQILENFRKTYPSTPNEKLMYLLLQHWVDSVPNPCGKRLLKACAASDEHETWNLFREELMQPPEGESEDEEGGTKKQSAGVDLALERGKELRHEEVLLDEIGGAITREDSVTGLAVRLLSKAGGGNSFLQNVKDKTKTNSDLAKLVLVEWVRVLPEEAYGARLLEVLREIKENAIAADFEKKLTTTEEKTP